ncbi:MAG: DUF692 family protein [Clostridiales bacterium]|nr:DUF692 family protein [Clostridiales bacterium]
MIELGCNYSLELMCLIKSDRVKIDWIKLSKEHQFHEQFVSVNKLRPALLHFVPCITSTSFPEGWNAETLNKAIEKCKSPHIALHMRANRRDLKLPLSQKEFLNSVVELIEEKKLSYCKEILVENMPSTCLPSGYEALADPEFIKVVCEICDIGICLDVAHAEISAFHRNESIEEYINKLPLHRVKEIHLSNPQEINGELKDTHESLNERNYEFLLSILEKTSPRIVTLEYGGEGSDYNGKSDILKIENQLNRLTQIINK